MDYALLILLLIILMIFLLTSVCDSFSNKILTKDKDLLGLSETWKKKYNKVKYFDFSIDRRYVVSYLFPAIGRYAEEMWNSDKRIRSVLNIGIRDYNQYDPEWCLTNKLIFHAIDKEPREGDQFSRYEEIYQFDMTKANGIPTRKYDIIIDYGVLGHPLISSTMNDTDVLQYIKNIKFMLNDNGLFFFKQDHKYPQDFSNIMPVISKEFEITPFYGLEMATLMVGNEVEFTTYVFSKK